MQKQDKVPKCTWLQNPPVPEHLMRPLFYWIHIGETPVLEMKRSTGKLVTINCLPSACGCGLRDTSRRILANISVTLVSWVGSEGTWGRGNGLVSSSAMSPTCRRTRHVGCTQSCSTASWFENGGSSGPWISMLEWQAPSKAFRACHINQKEYLWSETWRPSRRALKWDLRGMK